LPSGRDWLRFLGGFELRCGVDWVRFFTLQIEAVMDGEAEEEGFFLLEFVGAELGCRKSRGDVFVELDVL